MERLNEFYIKHKDDAGEKFLVDQKKFERLKEEAKPEILKTMLNDFDYYNCIETAFKFHILDTENKAYLYYPMETIRRQCYLNNEIWNENFITNRYFEEVKTEGINAKTKMKGHLFEKFDI